MICFAVVLVWHFCDSFHVKKPPESATHHFRPGFDNIVNLRMNNLHFEGTYTHNIHNSSTRSHPPEEENRSGNRNKIASVIGPSADHSLIVIIIYLKNSWFLIG